MYLIGSPWLLEFSSDTNFRKPTSTWKLNSALLSHHRVKAEIKTNAFPFLMGVVYQQLDLSPLGSAFAT